MVSSCQLNDVDERVDRLLLLVEAMWELTKEQHRLSDQHLADKLVELDEADGTADGRRTPTPMDCRSCGSKVTAGLPACQFCGTPVPAGEPDPFTQL